jgi:hypothetical protein
MYAAFAARAVAFMSTVGRIAHQELVPDAAGLEGLNASHRDMRDVSVPDTWTTSPSVSTPRKPSELRRAKQISGSASATKRSRFICAHSV